MKKKFDLQGIFASFRRQIDLILPMGVIRTNDFIETSDYEKSIYRAIHSVGRVWIPGSNEVFGSGFLISPDLFLTNQHVLPDEAAVKQAVIWVDYDEAEDVSTGNYIEAVGTKLLHSSFRTDLDYSLIKVQFKKSGKPAPAYINLRDFGRKPIPEKDSVIIVQHPGGGTRQIVTKDTPVVEVIGNRIRYEADTDEGSSGAPVFDLDYHIIGLHHEAFGSRNEAISIEYILKEIDDLLPA